MKVGINKANKLMKRWTSSNEDLAGAQRHGDGSVNELRFIGPVANDHFTDNKHLGLLGIIYNNI